MASDWMGLIGVIVGGGLTTGANYLMWRGERKKFARDRSWQLRMEAYTKIIEYMGAIEISAAEVALKYANDSGAENYEGGLVYHRDIQKNANAELQLHNFVVDNRIILSEKMTEWHLALSRKLNAIDDNEDGLEGHDRALERAKLVSAARVSVISLAKKELGFND